MKLSSLSQKIPKMGYKPLNKELPEKFFSNLMSRYQEKNQMDWKKFDVCEFHHFIDSLYVELAVLLEDVFSQYHKSEWGVFFCGERVQLGDSGFTLELKDVKKFPGCDKDVGASWSLYHKWKGAKDPLYAFQNGHLIDAVMGKVFWEPVALKKISSGVIDCVTKSFWRCPKTQSLLHAPVKKAIPIAPAFELVDKNGNDYDIWAIMIDDVRDLCKVLKKY